MSSSVPITVYASPMTSQLYQPGAELEAEHPMWHPALDVIPSQPHPTAAHSYTWPIESDHSGASESVYKHDLHSPVMDIVQPAPTRHIDAKHLESQSVIHSPDMALPHQPLYQQPLQQQQQQHHYVLVPEHEYESVHYYEAQVESSHSIPLGYYHGGQPAFYHGGAAVGYSVYSPYVHMQPSCPPTSYIQPYSTAVYGYTPPMTRRNSYAPYTPASSNPSSGNTSPQFDHLESPYEYETDALPTPITPTALPRSHMSPAANLLLAQAGITSEPITMLSSYHPQETVAPFETRSMHPEAHFQDATPYQPLSPVSPVLDRPVATSDVFSKAPAPASPLTPTAVVGFVVESGQPDDDLNEEAEIPAGATQTQAQAAERLKKLRERRHVIACSFCRGRKIACHSPVRVSQETEDGIPEGVVQSSSAQDDEYKPKTGSSSSRRVQPAGAERPACDNCVRRGRECVYPPRVPRVPRRRRKTATAAPAPPTTTVEHQHSQYPGATINTQLLQ